jgi:hypothetical protein
MTIVRIEEIGRFYSSGDEEAFFFWLKSIPAVKSFTGKHKGLSVEIADPIDDDSLRELIGLLSRYEINMSCLRLLAHDQNASWLKDKDRYWYNSIWQSA